MVQSTGEQVESDRDIIIMVYIFKTVLSGKCYASEQFGGPEVL